MKYIVIISGGLVLFFLSLIPGKDKFRKVYKPGMAEWFILSSLWILFFILLMVRQHAFITWKHRVSFFAFVFLECAWILLASQVVTMRNVKKIGGMIALIKKNIQLVAVMALILCIGFMHMHIVPMYDANLYYGQWIRGLQGLSFEFQSFLDTFTIWGKQFHPIAPLLLLGEALSAGTARGIYLINLLLLDGAVICVYEMALGKFRHIDKSQAAILGLIFGCSPFVMSGVTYITPDFYCAIFFVYMVYFYQRNWIWLFSYAALAFICMKRNMVVTYLLFLIIAEFKAQKISWNKAKKIAVGRPLALYVLPIEIMMLLYAFGRNSTIAMEQGQNTWLQKSVNRFFQAFVFGYKWLCLLGFLMVVALAIKKYGIKAVLEKKEAFALEIAIVISSLAQVVVYQFFNMELTLCSRYYAQNALMYTILLAFVLNYLFLEDKMRTACGMCIAFLYLAQLDKLMDPSMIFFADSLQFCKEKVYLSVIQYKDELIGIGDNMSYNFSYAMWNDPLMELLSDTKWDGDIKLYASVDDAHLLGCEDFRYGITFLGTYNVYWNSQKGRITYLDEGIECHRLSIISLTDETMQNQRNEMSAQDTIYLMIPDNMDDHMKEEIYEWGYHEIRDKEYHNDTTNLRLIQLQKN